VHPAAPADISLPSPVPPQITAGPSPLAVVVNEPVTLECDATGTPAPELLWLKDGNLVPSMVVGGPQVRQLLMERGLAGGVPPGECSFSLFWLINKLLLELTRGNVAQTYPMFGPWEHGPAQPWAGFSCHEGHGWAEGPQDVMVTG